MAGMKITLSAAMRARDVSRPRPEQVAEGTGPEEPAIKKPEEPAIEKPGWSLPTGKQDAPHAVGDAPDAPDASQPRTRRRRRRTR
jgi:hypothetical protein